MRDWRYCQITNNDFAVGVISLPLGHKTVRQYAGLALIRENAGIDL
jgi:hypothetical protein